MISTDIKKNRILFLDRDGVINKKRIDYVKNIDEIEFLPDIFNAIRKINELGFIIIIITNQSVVNRQIISEKKLNEIHDHMLSIMEKNLCKIAKIYYCPHHPNENCKCRKPKTGMIEQAVEDFKIDLSNAVLIGDSDSDIQAANKMKIKSIKIKTDGNLNKLITDNKNMFFEQS